jgi:hypothetical protein
MVARLRGGWYRVRRYATSKPTWRCELCCGELKATGSPIFREPNILLVVGSCSRCKCQGWSIPVPRLWIVPAELYGLYCHEVWYDGVLYGWVRHNRATCTKHRCSWGFLEKHRADRDNTEGFTYNCSSRDEAIHSGLLA